MKQCKIMRCGDLQIVAKIQLESRVIAVRRLKNANCTKYIDIKSGTTNQETKKQLGMPGSTPGITRKGVQKENKTAAYNPSHLHEIDKEIKAGGGGGRLQLVLMRHPLPAICQNLPGGGGSRTRTGPGRPPPRG